MYCPKCGGNVKNNKCKRCGHTLTKMESVFLEETYSSLYIFCSFIGLCIIASGILLISSFAQENIITASLFGVPLIISGLFCIIYGIYKKTKEKKYSKEEKTKRKIIKDYYEEKETEYETKQVEKEVEKLEKVLDDPKTEKFKSVFFTLKAVVFIIAGLFLIALAIFLTLKSIHYIFYFFTTILICVGLSSVIMGVFYIISNKKIKKKKEEETKDEVEEILFNANSFIDKIKTIVLTILMIGFAIALGIQSIKTWNNGGNREIIISVMFIVAAIFMIYQEFFKKDK